MNHADGYFPGEGDFEKLSALIARVRGACEDAGRDPATLTINTIFGEQLRDPAAGVEQMRSIGVDRIMVRWSPTVGLDALSTTTIH